ncbi:MAG: hypothetical protein H6574_11945 [Lewinellaceae bacterium]|nr:hypothetical protein [Saprospiraceae bacterium]MCB9317302.1 hypothetical protein [Lewinellaceae bacterium]MCB9331789.1 hypothetical protein [Lewinellaceae bacterium]
MGRNANYLLISAVFFILTLFLNSCTDSDSPATPNVSHIRVNLQLQRFEQDLFALDTTQLEPGLQQLAANYPDFLPFFIAEIAHDQTNPNETPLEAITGFVTAPQVRRLNDSCQAVFPDLKSLKADLTQMVQFYQYYLPRHPQPRFVTAVTEFIGDAYAVNDSLVMIGLDMFLGENFSGYNPDYFPQYLRRQFSREFITTKVALALSSRIVGPPPGEQILDYMINNGKILYLMDLLLPGVPDSMKMGYTQAQMEGCYVNEQEVWARLLDMGVLYQPLNSKNQKIVMPSPNADNVFQEAPGEIGNWVGWQIVKAYTKRSPDESFEEILNLRNAQQFLEKAKYKPKRVK